jgi:methylglyoxal synthase
MEPHSKWSPVPEMRPESSEGEKPNLVIVASPRARDEPSSPLLRLIRDYVDVLKRFTLHTTEGTSRMIYGTGLYERREVVARRAGRAGGIAQLAAMVARGECSAVILLLDPSDPWSDAVENRALRRICIQLQVRLITTYAAAIRWVKYEVLEGASLGRWSDWQPPNWRLGHRNVNERNDFKQLPLHERSIALISHDEKKLEMIQFANSHHDLLARHERILTTGTTGWLLKVLFSSQAPAELKKKVGKREKRLAKIFVELINKKGFQAPQVAGFEELLDELKRHLDVTVDEDFASKVMPLPSGPDGGDVLVADAVLDHQCHTIIFFHDPMTSHPHNDDIRLLEHTSQINGVFAECVNDVQSAERWVEGMAKESTQIIETPDTAQEFRRKFALSEAILIPGSNDDEDCDDLGQALARAVAGYIHHRLQLLADAAREVRIGVSWGWGAKQILLQLIDMEAQGLIQRILPISSNLIWSPLIGTITAEITDQEASMIAQGFCDFYGGRVEGFPCAGFARADAKRPEAVNRLIESLEEADLVITSASPWDEDTALYKNTGLDHNNFPPISEATSLISGIFLDANGKELKGDYSIVGLDFKGFQKAAKGGAVVLMCGGANRRKVLLAALQAEMASVVVTTKATAEHILRQKT